MQPSIIKDICIHFLCIAMLMIISFAIFTRQADRLLDSDLPHHMDLIEKYNTPDFKPVHFLFHSACHHIHIMFNINIKEASILTLILLQFMIASIFYAIFAFSLNTYYSANTIAIITLSLFFVSAIYFPFFNERIYLGQGSPNVWHNPTTITAKPFSFLALALCPALFNNRNKVITAFYLIGISLLLILSAWAKPNFIMAFLPALTIYCLLFHRNQIWHWVYYLFICTPLILILSYQYSEKFSGESSGTSIMISVLGQNIYNYTSNPFFSLFLLTAFPLVTLIVYPKILTNKMYVLTLLTFITAVMQYFTLAEEGVRYLHGNFGWGRQIVVPMLFVLSMKELLINAHLYRDVKNRMKQGLIASVFIAHLLSGLLYFNQLIFTDSFH
jgi:hypothetical protein